MKRIQQLGILWVALVILTIGAYKELFSNLEVAGLGLEKRVKTA